MASRRELRVEWQDMAEIGCSYIPMATYPVAKLKKMKAGLLQLDKQHRQARMIRPQTDLDPDLLQHVNMFSQFFQVLVEVCPPHNAMQSHGNRPDWWSNPVASWVRQNRFWVLRFLRSRFTRNGLGERNHHFFVFPLQFFLVQANFVSRKMMELTLKKLDAEAVEITVSIALLGESEKPFRRRRRNRSF